MKLVILISDAGTGTNLQAIIDAIERGELQAEIVAVISDKPDAMGLERARKHGVPIRLCATKQDLLPLITELSPDYICLAGWKQIILDDVILEFHNKVLNLHPGLVPDTPHGVVFNPDGTPALWNKGLLAERAIQNFLDQEATYAGSSIHFLSLKFDFGPVLGRTFEKIELRDTVESLYPRLKQKENQMYVDVLKNLAKS